MASLSQHVHDTHQSSVDRTNALSHGIATISSTLLSSVSVYPSWASTWIDRNAQHATSSTTFQSSFESSLGSLSKIKESTEKFLVDGMQEDVATGMTPRKKVWEVTTSWERTGPRQAVIDGFKRKLEMGVVEAVSVIETKENQDQVELATNGPVIEVSPSTESLTSLGSNNGVAVVNGLKDKYKAMNGNGVGKLRKEEKERPVMSVLGEGGSNVPRRARR